ncbi:MAG: UbiA family prenyltransferase [Planctomycetaceae bacterium]
MTRLRAWLHLVRLPAVFTAMADIFLGFLIPHPHRFAPLGALTLLLVASSCLYLAGMLFNDVFDREEDARLRPERPIPSGRVALRSAIAVGGALVAGGLIAAAFAGPNSLLTAGVLTACIFAYDGGAKRTSWGPPVMGACRFLNVMLGASVFSPFPVLAPLLGAGLAVYVAGVTAFARHEAEVSRPEKLAKAAMLVNAGIAILIGVVLVHGGAAAARQAVLLGVIALSIDLRLFAAIGNPSPAHVQAAVRTMLLSLVMLDAALVWFAVKNEDAPLYALATATLVIPALIVGRFMKMT